MLVQVELMSRADFVGPAASSSKMTIAGRGERRPARRSPPRSILSCRSCAPASRRCLTSRQPCSQIREAVAGTVSNESYSCQGDDRRVSATRSSEVSM